MASVKPTESIEQAVKFISRQALAASQRLVTLSDEVKRRMLHELAQVLINEDSVLLDVNRKDAFACQGKGLDLLANKIQLTKANIQELAANIQAIADQDDPIGERFDCTQTKNGLDIKKVRVPIGVIALIVEHDPVATLHTLALCLKTGNACILFGDGELIHTNSFIATLYARILKDNHIPQRAVQLVPSFDRQTLDLLLKQDGFIKCILPICGEDWMKHITGNTTIPLIREYRGVCNLYIDKDADPNLAEQILVNARCADPLASSSVKNVFIHQGILNTVLPKLAKALTLRGVELRIDSAAEGVLLAEEDVPLNPLTEADLRDTSGDLILAIKVVFSIESAIDEVNTYGSGLADVIITSNAEAAEKFFASVHSATVYWNASPLFTDGIEFELGGDIGISFGRIHTGALKLNELCAYKYIISGSGQTK